MEPPTLVAAAVAGVGVALLVGLALRPPATPSSVGQAPKASLSTRLARSRAARRVLGSLTALLLVGAGVSATWPFWTDQYQARLQVRLEEQLQTPEIEEAFRADAVAEGDSLTRLQAPAIGVDVVVVEGTSQAALRAGAGHYPETALPCGASNVAIAGHRTTFGAPFSRLDEMGPGDTITLETPVGTCRYQVSAPAFVVSPDEVEVVSPTDTPRLTLTTCHPKGSARQRLVLQADLVGDPLIDDRGGTAPPDIRGER